MKFLCRTVQGCGQGYPGIWIPDVPGISPPKTLALGHKILDGPNRQSPAFNERGQLSQAIPQFGSSTWNEYYTKERQSSDSNRNATNAGPMRTKSCVLAGEI